MVARLLLVLAFAAAFPPAARAGLFNPTAFTLANGLQVVVIEDRRVPIVSQMVWYKVGSADEPPGKSGIAHFLEHLMFKGTDDLPAGEFSKIVARNGGRDNAFTSYDYTAYYQNVAADKLDLVMGMEADRMADLAFDEEAFRTEMQVVLEERRQRTDNEPRSQLAEMARAAQWLNHPYRIPVIGWEHEIRGLSRDDALAFYRRWYGPNNAVLIVAGDVEAEAVRALAERHFGPLARVEVPERKRLQEPPQLAPRRVVMTDPRVRQPSLSRTYLAPSRTAGEAAQAVPLELFQQALGGGATSRLYRELVVNRKLAVSAGAWYSGVSLDETTIGVYATPAPGVEVETLEQALDETIAETLRAGLTAEELERARTGLLADAIYARDDIGTAPRVLGAALASGLSVEQAEAWPDLVETATLEAANAAARAVFDANRSVTSVLLPKPSS
jgi:zinc protease